MRGLKYFWKLVLAFISKFRGVILIGISLGFLAFVVFRLVAPLLLGGPAERVGMTGRFRPDNLPREILLLIGEGLTSTDAAGEVSPGLAESWVEKEGGKEWIFKIAADRKWQDGRRVTAETINYSFEDVVLERPDAQTIVFKLKTPFAPFPVAVSKPTFKKGLLGTGVWRVKNLVLAGGFVEKLEVQNKEGGRRTYKFFPTEERTKLAFKRGEVDAVLDLINPTPFDSWRGVRVNKTEDLTRVVTIFLNNKDPLFESKPLRQALAYGIKKEELEGTRAYGPISPTSWAYNPQMKAYEFDAERASELIEEAGVEAPEITLMTTPVLLPLAEKIVADWQEVGVNAKVQATNALPSEYQAFLAIYDMPLDPDQYSTWHSTQTGTNITNFNSKRIDKLLEDGRLELDREERRKIYLDFQRFLAEDVPAIFLYHPASYSVSRN